VPIRINYQGRILDNEALVNADVSLVLRLYNDQTAGDLLCEDSNTVTVVDGLYSTYIGDHCPPASLRNAMTNNPLYLEVEINGAILTPRERIVAVGYSLMADRVPNNAITSAMLANGAVGSNQLAMGAVQSRNLALGAVTGGHIATGAVASAQLAEGAVTSNKLAPESVGDTQLVKAYDSGSITRDDLGLSYSTAFQSMQTNALVSFDTAFDSAPVVVLTLESDSDALGENTKCHVRRKSATDFTASVAVASPEPVYPITDTWHGLQSTLADVNGRPAICSFDSLALDLLFVRALDAGGSAWAAPVNVDPADTTESIGNFLIVNGNPAIAYKAKANDDVVYTRATDVNGTSWDTPVIVDTNNYAGGYLSMAIVDGYPAMSYYDSLADDLIYVRALDTNGSTWCEPIRVRTNGNLGQDTSLAVVNGNPAISFKNADYEDLMYIRAQDSTGTNGWYPSFQVYTNGNAVDNYIHLSVAGGYPAMGFYSPENSAIMYVRSTNVNGGSGWLEPVTITTNGLYCAMEIINGRPAFAYKNELNDYLMFRYAGDSTGQTWQTSVTVPAEAYSGSAYIDLAEINGGAAISCFSGNTNLMYIRSSDFTTNTVINWVAIEP
jgi:hypothetical protein